MAKTTEEAQEMIEAAKRNGKKLTIGYQNRFRPDSQYLHKATERGDLGIFILGKHMLFVVEQCRLGVSS